MTGLIKEAIRRLLFPLALLDGGEIEARPGTLKYRFLDWLYGNPEQTTFCYCECGNELCRTSDCYDRGNGKYAYVCSKCGAQSLFLFDAPVPILLKREFGPQGISR